ncbi:Condensin-2 complex subunit G2 [Sesbania bispinosa]|nr:Condensin-2 complex subunit G2 [Sesbania bispinosa]
MTGREQGTKCKILNPNDNKLERDGEEASLISTFLTTRICVIRHKAKPEIFKTLSQNPNPFRKALSDICFSPSLSLRLHHCLCPILPEPSTTKFYKPSHPSHSEPPPLCPPSCQYPLRTRTRREAATSRASRNSRSHLAFVRLAPQKSVSPSDLLPGVQALHDKLIVFESDSVLSSAIESLCEEWWKENYPGRESLISQTLPFLLSRSLTLKKKVDVHRVYMFREAFALFDFEDESIEDLKLLLVRCVISPINLKTEDGRRFLSFIFGLSYQLGKELLAMIRSQIPFGRKSMLEAFGDILFRAWKAAQVDSRGEIENGFLQDLIDAAIHASSGAFASYIRRVLGAFINQRTIDGVEKLLYRLAEPVIFRSLQVANSNVRQNALHLLLDMFPLEDPDATKEEKDTLLDKQFFLLERLLMDDCPEVRTIAVEGSCRVLHLFWEIIPSPIITKIITKLFNDMSHDVSNEVRLSLLNGIIYLLGNPHSHEILKVLLPRLGHLILDNVLTVRVAAADLLLHLKDVRNFQFNKVVELDLLLSVLGSDQPPVAQKITKLLMPSYFPSKACEPSYTQALKEFLTAEKSEGLLAVASTGQAQSSSSTLSPLSVQ